MYIRIYISLTPTCRRAKSRSTYNWPTMASSCTSAASGNRHAYTQFQLIYFQAIRLSASDSSGMPPAPSSPNPAKPAPSVGREATLICVKGPRRCSVWERCPCRSGASQTVGGSRCLLYAC